ncbi:MAG: hypothetical protein QME81_18105, partial [bacterium]|nr:hypothetical protein [bacterium]
MLYCGFDLFHSSFRGVILSDGFAFLDHKFFQVEPQSSQSCQAIYEWIGFFKKNPQEDCLYFFDEWQFKNREYAHSLFLSLNDPERIYLIEHRKLLDIIQFIQTRIIILPRNICVVRENVTIA